MPWTPSPSNIRITNVFLFGWLLQTSGGLFRLASFQRLGRFFTYELALRENHDLITSGPYSVVRHPGYAGFAACIIGMWMCQLGSGSWLVESGVLETPIGKFGVFG
ncbi:hypothetical protein A0H81_06028 [Grifola frondosa]|uniref:Protein-S-isoprenylcysteine O-methyltransferase n=1 Tax=Grifola frondosa TaxID=5627 RepID=A0A1C7M9H1_GRIFR|nr:hypothetical protein A0H81_06028 [Grifola frondosa]